jgi:UDP:flavonoid glycosyltransferase YjiC (YdhE family)
LYNQSMKITSATVGTRGDVQPYIALGLGLQAAALQEATQDELINSTSGQLGDQIRTENGVSNAVKLIDSYLQEPELLMRFNP